jgi:hypothetical protein
MLSGGPYDVKEIQFPSEPKKHVDTKGHESPFSVMAGETFLQTPQ